MYLRCSMHEIDQVCLILLCSALLSRVRQSRFFTEGMTYMAALSTRGTGKVAPTPRTWQRIWDFTPRAESSDGSTLSVAGASGGSLASTFTRHGSVGQISELDHMARQALARFRLRMMKVEGAEAIQRLVSERLGLIDHLAALNRPMACGRWRFRGTRATAQVGIDEEVTNTAQAEYSSSGRLDEGSIGSDEEAKPPALLTPAKLNLARLSERQKLFNVFLHALTVRWLRERSHELGSKQSPIWSSGCMPTPSLRYAVVLLAAHVPDGDTHVRQCGGPSRRLEGSSCYPCLRRLCLAHPCGARADRLHRLLPRTDRL